MTESDPRIEGFMRAISAYFGIPLSEIEAVTGADETATPRETPASKEE